MRRPLFRSPGSANRCSNALAVVHVVIDTDGKVRSADFVSGYSEWKDPALAAVARWSRMKDGIRGQRHGGMRLKPSLLRGLVYDEAGNRYTPSDAVKHGRRYR